MDYITAGDARGQALLAVVQDVPAGLRLVNEQVESDLRRCLMGYKVPASDLRYVEIESGVQDGNTTGAPIAFLIYGDADSSADEGQCFPECGEGADGSRALNASPFSAVQAAVPRPGRGDLAAVLKTAADSVTAVADRLDAPDQAACVVAASVAREFLAQLGVEVFSFVSRIGSAALSDEAIRSYSHDFSALDTEFSAVRCPDQRTSDEMVACIECARSAGKTLGGTFQIVATGLLPGLGCFAQRRQRLNAQLATALFSLPQVVAVEFGRGSALAESEGPACHDAVLVSPSQGFSRASNYAGGIEDGLTSGEPLLISVSLAPAAPTGAGKESVNLDTLQLEQAKCAGAPVCVVPGAAVAAEAEVAFVLANAYLKQFGNANMTDICASVAAYADRLRRAAR